MSIILQSDGYKFTHAQQYPPDTEKIYSYFESRGGKFPSTTFFGLQYYLKKYLEPKVTQEDIEYAEPRIKKYMGSFNREGWEYIVKEHGGFLPVKIMAVKEGSLIPNSNVLMTVVNTDPKCFWLTNYLETLLSKVWYACTVATQSYYIRKTIQEYLDLTGDESVDFKCHDFGYRGVSSEETAGLGGMAHLTSFKGTDTYIANEYAKEYYDEDMAGFSIPATEHSTVTSWGEASEVEAMRHFLETYPEGAFACVSDSYDIFRACRDYWGKELREQVLSRNGVTIIRPDSGDPVKTPIRVLEILMDRMGYTTNKKGYKVLHPKVRVIQGDGVDYEVIGEILNEMMLRGYSADNIAFGSGGALLQKLDRDTQKFAFKCSAIQRSGEWYDVYKNPLFGGKESKRGLLCLIKQYDKYITTNDTNALLRQNNLLETAFENGLIRRTQTFADIRSRLEGI